MPDTSPKHYYAIIFVPDPDQRGEVEARLITHLGKTFAQHSHLVHPGCWLIYLQTDRRRERIDKIREVLQGIKHIVSWHSAGQSKQRICMSLNQNTGLPSWLSNGCKIDIFE